MHGGLGVVECNKDELERMNDLLHGDRDSKDRMMMMKHRDVANIANFLIKSDSDRDKRDMMMQVMWRRKRISGVKNHTIRNVHSGQNNVQMMMMMMSPSSPLPSLKMKANTSKL